MSTQDAGDERGLLGLPTNKNHTLYKRGEGLMSKQRHRPNQAQANKATKNHRTSGKKQHPAPQGVAHQTHPLQPSLLQHALENLQTARPETILQLQRLYGNQAVGQLLAQQGNAPSSPQPALGSSPTAIQREINDFKFTGKVGAKAELFSERNKAYKAIKKTFEKYKEVAASKKEKLAEEYAL
jgi:hypothetical protein